MRTSKGTRRGGRDGTSDDPDGPVRNRLDDAFDLAGADDEELVYEWVADDDPGSRAEGAERGTITRAGFRETVLRLRAEWPRLRRLGAITLAVAVLTTAASVGATAWFDTVARGADEATVTDLALDAVVDGDPALAKFDVDTTRGTTQFVLEVANNGPAAVTLVGLSVDAGTLMTSTAWQPIGSPLIGSGATGDATLTVDVDCRLLMLGQAISSNSAGPTAFSFPDVHASVRTRDGELRKVTLSARKRTPPDSLNHANDLSGVDLPQTTMTSVIDMTSVSECGSVLTQQQQKLSDSGRFPGTVSVPPVERDPDQIAVTYTGVQKSATPSSPEYVLGFRAHNPTAVPMTTFSDPGKTGVPSNDLVTMTPSRSTIPSGGDADFTLTVKIATCHDGLNDQDATQYFVSTAPESDGSTAGGPQFGALSHFMTGTGVQIALDELAQRKAACP